MRKLKKTYLGFIGWSFILTSTLLLSSCSDTENVLEETETPINFSMPNLSRATFINSINDFDVFGVWAKLHSSLNTSVQIYNGDNVMRNSNSETGWVCATKQYWVPNCTYDFFAVHPNNNIDAEMGESDISINEYDVTTQEDLIMASQKGVTEESNNGTVSFSFHHALGRIEFVGKTDADDTNATLTGLKVYGTAKTGNCEWNGSAGSNNTPNIIWNTTDSETTNASDPLYNKGDFNIGLTSTESSDLTGGILVIPQTITEGTIAVEISYLMNGSSKTKTIYIPASTWEHGKSYKYSFTVQYNGYIEFAKPEVTLWGNAEAGSIVVE